MKIFFLIFIQLLFLFNLKLYSQVKDSVSGIFLNNEVYFSFKIDENINLIKSLSNNFSIEKINENTVFAYSTKDNFLKLNEKLKNIKILQSEFANKNIPMAKSLKEVLSWNYYPTYSQYEQLVSDFATSYPEICKLENIGQTVNGRNIWVLKISDNVQIKEAEPEFLYSATIHGNEPIGYVLSLRLIEYILTNYTTNNEIADLINNYEIWINPLANPDGTYAIADSTINGATRFNANGIDLNRNFPDPENGSNPDGESRQPENIAMMDFVKQHNFVISAHLHTGSEVVNYPWDTWSKLHTDDIWFQKISHQYADTAQLYSFNGYFDDYNDGITNGYQWYEINGGAQDYLTYFQNSRSITLELSSTHLVDTSLLSNYWEYNYRSLINLIKNCNLGINGIVTDSLTGQPVKAEITIIAHDFDNSFVISDSLNGDFYRPIMSGIYSILVTAPKYYSYQLDDVSIIENESKYFDIKLVPIQSKDSCNGIFYAQIINYPISDVLKIKIVNSNAKFMNVKIINSLGKELFYNKLNSICNTVIELNLGNLNDGIYYIILTQASKKIIAKYVKM